MSKPKIKVKEGNIFVLSDFIFENGDIESLKDQHRLAKVVFISKKTKLMIAIVISKDTFDTLPDSVEDVVFSNSIFYTGSQLLKNGGWKIIGNQPVSEYEKNLTLRIVGSRLYLLDEDLGVVPSGERKKYNRQLIAGIGALYYRINNL